MGIIHKKIPPGCSYLRKDLFTLLRFIITPCFILFCISALAGGDNNSGGARSAGLGNASVAVPDLWSCFNNQAGLAKIENIQAGILYSNSFLLSALGIKGAAVAVPVPHNNGVAGISYSQFGYSLYRDSKASLAYSMNLGEKIAAGVQFDYLNTFIGEGYGSRDMVTIEGGILATVTKELSLGIHVFNPVRTKMATFNNERVPSVFRFGMRYLFSEKVFLAIEAEKDIDMKPSFKGGVEYRIIESVFLRTGASTQPVVYAFGVGYIFKNFSVDVAATIHQVLGFSPQIAISYHFVKNKKTEVEIQ